MHWDNIEGQRLIRIRSWKDNNDGDDENVEKVQEEEEEEDYEKDTRSYKTGTRWYLEMQKQKLNWRGSSLPPKLKRKYIACFFLYIWPTKQESIKWMTDG